MTNAILALDGGKRVRTEPLPPWPYYAADEIASVAAVLSSGHVNYWTGSQCMRFEEEYARSVGVRHAISLANGTVALELALRAYGIGHGDEVIVPSRTFIASASCAVAVGAVPVVADVDRDSLNLTVDTIRPHLTQRTRAIVAVHLAGWPCDMDPIMALAAERGLIVIEDCAQAHGATYKGRPVGSLGHCAAFSFCQDKIITTGGEGGLLLLDDAARWEAAWAYKDHGKSYDATFRREHAPGYRWLHESFGTNWRMTEMQAAIGRMQLDKLSDWVARRRRNADLLAAGLASVPALRVPKPGKEFGHAWYRFHAFLDPSALRPGWSQQRVIEAIDAEGIPCSTGSCGEIYRERAFADAGLAPVAPHPVARELEATSLAFLTHPTLNDDDMHDACAAIVKVMAAAT